VTPDGRRVCKIAIPFRRLLKICNQYRKGIGFYTLRHTFQTIGDGAGDPVATSSIMGHADGTMAGVYREMIEDERLLKVPNHVHDWLFKQTAQPAEDDVFEPVWVADS